MYHQIIEVIINRKDRSSKIELRIALCRYHGCLRLICTTMASRGVVRSSILSRDRISRERNMTNGKRSRKRKEEERREESGRTGAVNDRTMSVYPPRQSLFRSLLLFVRRPHMWVTSPRYTSPLISDNPPKEQKSTLSHTHTHTRARSRGTHFWSC